MKGIRKVKIVFYSHPSDDFYASDDGAAEDNRPCHR